jgi:hypothetical protein
MATFTVPAAALILAASSSPDASTTPPGAARYLKAAGADLNDIKETLGHSSIAITADTYTSVIQELETERAKADAATALIPRTHRNVS